MIYWGWGAALFTDSKMQTLKLKIPRALKVTHEERRKRYEAEPENGQRDCRGDKNKIIIIKIKISVSDIIRVDSVDIHIILSVNPLR